MLYYIIYYIYTYNLFHVTLVDGSNALFSGPSSARVLHLQSDAPAAQHLGESLWTSPWHSLVPLVTSSVCGNAYATLFIHS